MRARRDENPHPSPPSPPRSGGGDDELVRLARNRLGDYHADRKGWGSAIPLYKQVGNYEALVETCV